MNRLFRMCFPVKVSRSTIYDQRVRLLRVWNLYIHITLFISLAEILFALAHIVSVSVLLSKFQNLCPLYSRQRGMSFYETKHSTCNIQIVVLLVLILIYSLRLFVICTASKVVGGFFNFLLFNGGDVPNMVGLFVSKYMVDLRKRLWCKFVVIIYKNYLCFLGLQLVLTNCVIALNLNFWSGWARLCAIFPGSYTLVRGSSHIIYFSYLQKDRANDVVEFTNCFAKELRACCLSLLCLVLVSLCNDINTIIFIRAKVDTHYFLGSLGTLIPDMVNKAYSLQMYYLELVLESKEFLVNVHSFQTKASSAKTSPSRTL